MTDTAATVTLPTAKALADEFAALLCLEIGRANLEKVVRLNPTYGEACAAHDFCDANMVMLDAFVAMVPGVDADDIIQRDDLNALWDEAWGIAKASAFEEFLGLVAAS